MVTEIVDAVGDWAVELVFNPFIWLGLILGGVSVVCFVVAGFLANRGVGAAPGRARQGRRPRSFARARASKAEPVLADDPVDAEMAEIEALLRKRGIT